MFTIDKQLTHRVSSIEYRPVEIASEFSILKRTRYREQMDRERRKARIVCAKELGISRPTLNDWELKCVIFIPDYARFYEARKGLNYYQVWVLNQLIPRFKNGLGQPKMTGDDLENGIKRMSNKLTLEDYFDELTRGSQTA